MNVLTRAVIAFGILAILIGLAQLLAYTFDCSPHEVVECMLGFLAGLYICHLTRTIIDKIK